METTFDPYDTLDFMNKEKSFISKELEKDEKLYVSCKLFKYNEKNKR